MTVELMPDAEVIARQWLIDDEDVAALVGTNVSTRLPADPSFPFIVVELVRTVRSSGEAFLQESWVQIDVYADRGDFRSASEVARTIQAIGDDWSGLVVPIHGESAYVYGTRLENFRRIVEPDTGWARYMIDLQFQMRKG